MKKQITVCVTQNDIDTGARDYVRRYTECPVALAVKRHYKGKVRVGGRNVTLGKRVIGLPPKAQTFINDFDSFGKYLVQPFKFHLLVNKR